MVKIKIASMVFIFISIVIIIVLPSNQKTQILYFIYLLLYTLKMV